MDQVFGEHDRKGWSCVRLGQVGGGDDNVASESRDGQNAGVRVVVHEDGIDIGGAVVVDIRRVFRGGNGLTRGGVG